MYGILDKIDTPADIKSLSMDELRQLCAEIREHIVKVCSVNPGHLASSLGAVELIVGMHYVYDAPSDKLVFDVGHQAYAHKILTGRREAFTANRTKGGISGFPNMSESEYDAFGTGHSSTSISAALGMAEASRIQELANKVVALIGDGAMTGGLAFEGLNNAGASKADILVILNDNDQSIGPNIGGLHEYLLKITTDPTYNRIKSGIWERLGEGRLREKIQRFTRKTKTGLVGDARGMFFEALGFRYFGPIDGNDISQVVSYLRRLRTLRGPRLLHAITVKGKGYAPAEADPTTWHAPGSFNVESGEIAKKAYAAPRYQDVFGDTLCDLAAKDSRVVGITPAMTVGSGLGGFAGKFRDRFFDVGIEEEHAVTFAAGLAAGGLRPFCCIYSSFAQRAYDQIIHDVALQRLPVVLCLDKSGLVGEDGATHSGSFDLAALRCIPGVTICAPADEAELKLLMFSALHHGTGPFIIRYPRGCAEGLPWKDIDYEVLPDGKASLVLDGDTVAVLALGPMVHRAAEAAETFRAETGITPLIYNMRWLKPLDTAAIDEAAARCKAILTVEDGTVKGGLHGAVAEYVASKGLSVRVEGAGIPDSFLTQDTQAGQRHSCGLDAEGIALRLSELCGQTKKEK